MSNPLASLADYEHFVHTIMQQFRSVRHSTVAFVRRGATLARIAGELQFDLGLRLVIRQRLAFHRLPGVIDEYGYEVWKGDEKLYWYDSQPHPRDSTLQSTHPHHKHLPPDIKHHRIPAPGMSFTRPNLPALIREVEVLMKTLPPEGEPEQA
ncbi:MAG: hypothetical protein HY713_06690 [candidate division NC10 bacterium]|nr:hypothetical protein [candidate division NC10 bacterium]